MTNLKVSFHTRWGNIGCHHIAYLGMHQIWFDYFAGSNRTITVNIFPNCHVNLVI